MNTVADECWKIAAECEHGAEESQDNATRLAFRQIAKALAGLAFSENFAPTDEPIGQVRSENSKAAEHAPKVDAEQRDRTQRLSLRSPTPFPKR